MDNLDAFGNPRIYLECECSTEHITVTRWTDDEDKSWFIDYYLNGWYAKQETPWQIFKNRIVAIWKIATGKEYSFFDIVVTDDQMNKLVSFVNKNL